jgi:hypothetical protein
MTMTLLDEIFGLVNGKITEETYTKSVEILQNNYRDICFRYNAPPVIPPKFAFFRLIKFSLSRDPRMAAFIDDCGAPGNDLSTKAFCFVHDIATNLCPFGKTMSVGEKYKPVLSFCASVANCACALSAGLAKRQGKSVDEKAQIQKKINEKHSSKTVDEKQAIVQKRNKTFMERYGADRREIQDKTSATCLKRYGTKHATSSPIVRNKITATMQERYGVDSPYESSEIRDKTTKTMMDRYGVERPLCLAEMRAKATATLLKNTGYDNCSKNPETRAKVIANHFEKYGVENPRQRPEVAASTKKTMMDRYGVAHPMHVPEIKERMINTVMQRYGVINPAQSHFSEHTTKVLNDATLFETFVKDRSFVEAATSLGIDRTTIEKYYAKYGIHIEKKETSYEIEISKFLDDHSIKHERKNRSLIKPKELDFYLPNYNVAIEFNGLFYHCDSPHGRSDRLYHWNKTTACKAIGIRLIQIYEDEWIYRKESVKGRILSMCGKIDKGMGARKLDIRPIENKQAHEFMDSHHIQGRDYTSVFSVGAFFEDSLRCVMSFRAQRGTGIMELSRFCSNGKTYAGAFSRMFKFAVNYKNMDEVVTYADLRYSVGDLYFKTGFTYEGNTEVTYRYVKGDRTYHKSHLSKANMRKRGIEIGNKTETQIAAELKYYRIYDCGKMRFRWRRQ